jgi:hypothetical protein
MAVGVSTTLSNSWLNVIRGGAAGTTYTAPAAVYVQLHTANPGTAGTTSVSSVTTRQAATFSASTTGVLSLSNTPSFTSWAGTNGEVVSHVSFWDASSTGNFLWSAALTASKTINTGDTLNISSASLTITTAS